MNQAVFGLGVCIPERNIWI
uniref:Uncharacterized protein n=1 Tax=Arundo donax TaxID=35708 RepID=A0A0A9BUK3_ARUDO